MPLPAKRKTETGAPPRGKSKVGARAADSTSGPAKKKMNRPVAGLTESQMMGGSPDEPDESKAVKQEKKPTRKKVKPNPFGGNY